MTADAANEGNVESENVESGTVESKTVESGNVDAGEDKKDSLDDGEVQLTTREVWGNAFDFLLACIGFSVGLGNVWRFPYLCYKNGGGAFLLPYFLFVIIGGIPLFYLEVAVGQYMSKGGLQAWNMVPLFQGIGLASCIIVFYLNIYYNVILAWSYYYFFSSFASVLPWKTCDNGWNTVNCSDNFAKDVEDRNVTEIQLVDPVTEYWERKVLNISDGLHDMGEVKWDLCLCLLFGWIIVYCCICKGIKSSGKVMYVTATSPYIFMTILLVKNCTLEGASDGVAYYLTPDISRLADPEVWVDAGTQIFFSSSIALGTLTALGSYNKFNQNSFRDSIVFAAVNSGTSFFSGFLVFTILGHMAKLQNKDIADLAAKGPGLAFITYPTAVLQLPAAPMWSALFFLMIILLGLDSMFVGVEGVVTTFVDQYPRILRMGNRKEYFIAVCCIIMFLAGIPMVTRGGMYVFQIFDFYSGSRIILLVALFELIAIAHVYGAHRFADNVKMMVGDSRVVKLLPYMIVCWTTLSPIFCITVFILNAMNYTELTYSRPNRPNYLYPDWAVAFGWCLAGSSAIWVPIVGIYKWYKNGATMEVLKLLCVPYYLHPHQRRPQDEGEHCLYDYELTRKGLPFVHLGFKNQKSMGAKTHIWNIGYTGYNPEEYSSSLTTTPSSSTAVSPFTSPETPQKVKTPETPNKAKTPQTPRKTPKTPKTPETPRKTPRTPETPKIGIV